ncbi:MAG: dTMP kinase [Candidatus Pelagibacter sp.]|jgi:dTMP kinase|nr:dTMP kinase [Candidatus Pelagibacter sp.]
MSKNPIIVFEGIEGSGKSLHINNVANYLKKINRKFIRIREPGGSKNSEKIRKLILDNKSSFNVNTDLLLYMSARSENINLIKKNYKKKIILIDRFVDSTIAYQHYGFGVDIKIINLINKFLLKNIKVTFTFLNIVSLKNMNNRLKKRKKLNRYDKFNTVFYNKVQKGFLDILKKKKNKYLKVNSNLEINLNKKLIINKIKKLIK